MEFFNVQSVNQANKIIYQTFSSLKVFTETVALKNSLNRFSALDAISKIDNPPFNRSTVDGYAVIHTDTTGASDNNPVMFKISGSVEMGYAVEHEIHSGYCIYIPTGGVLPNGADSVVMIEYTEVLNNTELIITKPVVYGENIIFRGDDFLAGHKLLSKGKRITPFDIACLAAGGINHITVFKNISFAVISTGDELCDTNENPYIDLQESALPDGKIFDINSETLSAMITSIGGIINFSARAKDDLEDIKSVLRNAVETSDIVLISGGSSVGVKDYTIEAINSLPGKGVFVNGISMKPGKPFIAGECSGKAVFGLPGHPLSAVFTFIACVEPLYYKLLGSMFQRKTVQTSISENVHSSPGKTSYQLVALRTDTKSGTVAAHPIYSPSGLVSVLSKADGYLIIPDDSEGLLKNTIVAIFMF